MRPGDSEVKMQTASWTQSYISSRSDNNSTIIVPTPVKADWGTYRSITHNGSGSISGTITPSRTTHPHPTIERQRLSPVDRSLGVANTHEKLNSRGHPLIRMKKPNKTHLNHLEAAEILCFTEKVEEENVMMKNAGLMVNNGMNGVIGSNSNVRLPSIGSLINTLNLPQETPETLDTQETMEIESESGSDEEDESDYDSSSEKKMKVVKDSVESSPVLSPSVVQNGVQDGEQKLLVSTAPVKKRTDIETIIEKTHGMLPAKEDPKFFDITHLLTLPQADAAKAVRLSKPTFCKRWKEAVGSERKWPHRYILKIDREIRQLKSQQKRLGQNEEIESRLKALTQKRKVALTPTSIRL